MSNNVPPYDAGMWISVGRYLGGKFVEEKAFNRHLTAGLWRGHPRQLANVDTIGLLVKRRWEPITAIGWYESRLGGEPFCSMPIEIEGELTADEVMIVFDPGSLLLRLTPQSAF